ncbi:MAG TPA: type II toxin-antitoxin system ParD family antitoxin [Phycisphaerales bacterium]|nr:type II toxin-antitoxin system ParD family antitoxin [Phycisphaerales bacterium]
MAKRTTANVSLTPKLQEFVDGLVASGRYQSTSEVIREALRLLEYRERQSIASLEDLKREVEIGLKEAREGKLIDGPTVFRKARERILKQAKKQTGRRRAG